ncbi:MAG TPA: hypothetical protein ENN72_06005 [Firmicutes bacterium]|nr:hypothetical protein [Bacillota bacterium]
MSGFEKKYDETFIDSLLFSRSKPRISEDLKENTLYTLTRLKEDELQEEAVQKKFYRNIVGVFSILILLFGILIAQNIQFFQSLYLLAKDIFNGLRLESFVRIGKFVVIGLAAVPAMIIFFTEKHKKKSSHHIS